MKRAVIYRLSPRGTSPTHAPSTVTPAPADGLERFMTNAHVRAPFSPLGYFTCILISSPAMVPTYRFCSSPSTANDSVAPSSFTSTSLNVWPFASTAPVVVDPSTAKVKVTSIRARPSGPGTFAVHEPAIPDSARATTPERHSTAAATERLALVMILLLKR